MEQAARDQVTDGSLDPVALSELRRVDGQLADQLIERQRRRIEEENFSEDPRLVVSILGGGRGAFIIVRAFRLVVHGS
jgi:hypothetical protein